MSTYYDFGVSKNAQGLPSHPIDTFMYWRSSVERRNELAALMDSVMKTDCSQAERFANLEKLLSEVSSEIRDDEAFHSND